jgi:hypothetical protein
LPPQPCRCSKTQDALCSKSAKQATCECSDSHPLGNSHRLETDYSEKKDNKEEGVEETEKEMSVEEMEVEEEREKEAKEFIDTDNFTLFFTTTFHD